MNVEASFHGFMTMWFSLLLIPLEPGHNIIYLGIKA